MIETRNKQPKKYFLPVILLLVIFFSWKFFPREKRVLGIYSEPKEITINDNGIRDKLQTNANSVEEILTEKNIQTDNRDYIYPDKKTPIISGTNIEIQRIKNMSVFFDGSKKEISGFSENVEKILKENNINFKDEDIIEPSRDSFAYNGLEITIVRVELIEEIEEDPIDFKTVGKEDDSLGWRTKKTIQKGIKGIKEIKYEVAYHDGEEVGRKIIDTKVTKEPTEEIIVQGTYMKLGKAQKGDASFYASSWGELNASRTIPRGGYAKVTNLDNGKSVVVKINDYGPQSPKRIIDLSYTSFSKIGDLGQGILPHVKVEQVLN